MSGGGGTTSTVTENADPWGPQQQPLQDIFGYGADIYQNAPSGYYPGQTWLPFNEMQNMGINEQLGNVSSLQNMAGQTQQGLGTLLNAPNLDNNPYAQQWSDALEQNLGGMYDRMAGRVGKSFNEQILPGISSEAVGMGQSGSSRQGVAEGLAAQGAQQELSDLALQMANQGSSSMADFYSNQYGQGLDAAKAGLIASPTVAGMSQMPYQSLQQVGDVLQNQAYLPLQEDMARYNFNQQAPWNDLFNYQAIVNGLPGGLGSSSSSSEVPSNTIGSAVGGASLGYGAASLLGLSNPWTAGLALGGGLLGGIL